MGSAVKLDIIIPESHRVELTLPAELPSGPAEVIVRSAAHRDGESSAGEEATREGAEGPRNLAELFAGRVGLIDSGGRETLSQEGGEKFADHLEAKRRAGHL
jgi:hypothetical protein